VDGNGRGLFALHLGSWSGWPISVPRFEPGNSRNTKQEC